MITRKLSFLPFALLSVLFIPLVAMQFSEEVNWSLGDFAVMGTLLLGLGFGLNLILKRTRQKDRRIVGIVLLILAFLLIWVELAVGIFGSPLAGS